MEFFMRKRNQSGIFRSGIEIACFISVFLFTMHSVEAQDTSAGDDDNLFTKVSALTGANAASDSSPPTSLNKMITVEYKETTLKAALEDIAQRAGFQLSYSDQQVPLTKRVTLESQDVTVNKALWKILEGTDLRFALSPNNHLVLTKRDNAKQEVADETITGTVTDAGTGDVLPGVNIQIKGTTTGTSSDANGQFELNVPSLQDTLVFSFVGYQTNEVPINGQTEVDVAMQSEAVAGDEVVVVGYGTQQESDLTGSVGSVKSDELMERPAVNVEQTLSGKMAGVNVSTNSGRPGGRTEVRIRGYGSINASNNPLYVVDGVVMPRDVATINPNNIESIEVLKDASATAIYGTRGSNGVILITTKRGEEKESSISYNGYVSVSNMARKQDLLNSEEFLDIEEQAYENAEKFDPTGFENGIYTDPIEKRQEYVVGNEEGNPELFDENLDPLYDTDWQDAVTRTAVSQGHNLSYTGGTDETTYGLYMGYSEDNGIIKTTHLQRANIRGVLDTEINDWIKVGGTMSYASNNERRADERVGANNVPRMMIEMIPIVPYQYSDGTYGRREDYDGMESGDNPQAQLNEDNRQYRYNDFNGNTFATLTPLDNLEFTSRLGVNVRNQHNPYFNSTRSNLEGLGQNYAEIWSNESRFWQWTNHLNYTLDINDNHSIYSTLGAELQDYNYLEWFSGTSDMPDDYYEWNNLGAGSSEETPSSAFSSWQMASYFARVNYNYDDRYLLTATGRVDGSSRFGTDNKYAFFPSAALAWRVSEEDFIKESENISNLKLRVSYGLTGNSEIGEYLSMANMTTNEAIFDGSRSAGTIISTLANPELQWEKTAQYNVGMDLGLFNDRVEFAADVYLKKTKDLLLGAPIPNTSGYEELTRNIGSMENRGFEFAINTINVESSDFSWTSSLNYSYVKNEITSLGVNDEDIFPGPNFLNETNVLRVGESVGSLWGLVREGTWDTDEADEAARYNQEPGDLKFRDVNDDGDINNDDYTIIGNGMPDFYGTFTNSFNYKNFDLNVELQYMVGHDVFKLTEHSSLDRTGIANSYAEVLDAWTPDNQNTSIAQWRPTSAGYDSFLDTHKVKDGSFLRGKNIALGYTLPSDLISEFGLQNARFYMSAQNFFLLTEYDGYDPETTTYSDPFSQGIQFHDYPKARTVLLGVNLSF